MVSVRASPTSCAGSAKTAPDVVCLQELKAPQEKFPEAAIREAGLWCGLARPEELERSSHPGAWGVSLPKCDAPSPGDPDDLHSRYVEATVRGIVIGCFVSAERQPEARAEVRLQTALAGPPVDPCAELVSSKSPVILAGDYNVIPTERDVYKPERWVEDALFRIEVRESFARLTSQGWTDALRTIHPNAQIYTFWGLFSQCLRTRCRLAYRSSAAQPGGRRPASGCRGRPGRARLGESERSRPNMGETARLKFSPGRPASKSMRRWR